MTVTERLLHYVSFDTQSDESSETCPSTAKQKLLGEALVEEMRALGIADARIDADGYVYGSVPGTPGAPAIGLIALLVAGAVAPANIPIIIVCGLFYKFGSGLTLGATTVMLADVIDYGEVKLGTRNESIVASFQTLLVKTASAVAGWLIGVGLTIFGYVENVPQTPETIMGMRILMGVIPSIVTVLAFVIYVKGYKLDSSAMENITKQLKEKNKVNN